MAGAKRRRLPRSGPPRARCHAAAAGRAGRRDRHRMRACARLLLHQACGNSNRHARAGYRVVLDDEGREVRLQAPYDVLDDARGRGARGYRAPEDSAEPTLDALEPAEPFSRGPAQPSRVRAAADASTRSAISRRTRRSTPAGSPRPRRTRWTIASWPGCPVSPCASTARSGKRPQRVRRPRPCDSARHAWSVYCFEVDGKTVVDAYLDAHRRRCSPEEQRWLDAQRDAWLSVWEVEDVEPGETVTLRDLLSDERRIVRRSARLEDAGAA